MRQRGAAAGEGVQERGRAFGALQHRDFRLFWVGLIVYHLGLWMQNVAQSWLIFQMTGNPLLVGLDGLFKAVPFLATSLYAGTVIDRADRRKVLIWIQNANGALAAIIGLLVLTGHVEVWHLYLNSFCSAALGAFEGPARQALLPHLIPRRDLMTALSLNSNVRKGSQMVGPAIGGVLVATVGVAVTYFLNAASTVILLWCLVAMRTTNPPRPAVSQSAVAAIKAGLQYATGHRVILALLIMQSAVSLFGSYLPMLVVYAERVYSVGPQGLGLLQSAAGGGSVLGSLVLASRGDIHRKGRLLVACGALYAAFVVAFAWSPSFVLALACLVCVGAADVVMGTASQTMVQLQTREDMLGRVMSLNSMSQRGLSTFGGFQAGALTSLLGVQAATTVGALACLAAVSGITLLLPQLRSFAGNGPPVPDHEPPAGPAPTAATPVEATTPRTAT